MRKPGVSPERIIEDDLISPYLIKVGSNKITLLKRVKRYKRKTNGKVDLDTGYMDDMAVGHFKDIQGCIRRIVEMKLVSSKKRSTLVEYVKEMNSEYKKISSALEKAME